MPEVFIQPTMSAHWKYEEFSDWTFWFDCVDGPNKLYTKWKHPHHGNVQFMFNAEVPEVPCHTRPDDMDYVTRKSLCLGLMARSLASGLFNPPSELTAPLLSVVPAPK